MTGQNETWRIYNPALLAKNALLGAGIGVALLGAFFGFIMLQAELGLGNMIFLPFLTVAIGGACGGVFYYLMGYFRQFGSWQKVVAHIISFLVYCAGLWMSLVFALAITGHWD
ncbi:MAG: hypothetical protein K0R65_1592 [Crocinitomicaceae bacterium]|jgi:hypothetical protein|nr:hypothetical protein [Crocinitomicaceae bacterium]